MWGSRVPVASQRAGAGVERDQLAADLALELVEVSAGVHDAVGHRQRLEVPVGGHASAGLRWSHPTRRGCSCRPDRAVDLVVPDRQAEHAPVGVGAPVGGDRARAVECGGVLAGLPGGVVEVATGVDPVRPAPRSQACRRSRPPWAARVSSSGSWCRTRPGAFELEPHLREPAAGVHAVPPDGQGTDAAVRRLGLPLRVDGAGCDVESNEPGSLQPVGGREAAAGVDLAAVGRGR